MENLGVLRVLLVEPHRLRRDVIQQILHGLEVDCLLAGTASEALWKLCRGHYDVVVIAEELPNMSGRIAAQAISKESERKPWIIGLAQGGATREAFLAAGADEVFEPVPGVDCWREAMTRISPRPPETGSMDLAALEAWWEFQGPAAYEAVVSDYLRAGVVAVGRLRQQIFGGDAARAARTVRVFGEHSRAVGARGLARACEDLRSALLSRDLGAASDHFERVQDDWWRILEALEAQSPRIAS